jgi:hypothetical protein
MGITLQEVLDHAARWFDTVMIHGGSAAEQAAFFLHPHPRIFVVNIGAAIDMEDQARLHRQWTNEVHRLGSFTVTPLNDSPERVRAVGTVYLAGRVS